jgi:aspartate/methionine/tyrosine aminotransferase
MVTHELGLDRHKTGSLPRAMARDLTPDSAAFAKAMLRDIGVAITPGIDFDPVRGHRFVRLSYAGPHAAMREASARIKGWLKA